MNATALLAALLLLRPAAAADWEADPETETCTANNFKVIEVVLPNILLRRVGELPSSQAAEAAAFLRSHQNLAVISLAFQDRERARRWGRYWESNPDVLMAYHRDDRRFSMAHKLVHLRGGDELRFSRDETAQKELALAVADSFVHEISHAREAERRPGLPQFVEDELVSYYRETLFRLDMLRLDPGFNRLKETLALQRQACALRAKNDQAGLDAMKERYREVALTTRVWDVVLFQRLAKSNAAFEKEVASVYEKLPSLFGDAAPAVARLEGLRRKLEAADAKLRALGEPGDPSVAATLARIAADEAFWRDPKALGAARPAFAAELKSLRDEADRRRAAYELKDFDRPSSEVVCYPTKKR